MKNIALILIFLLIVSCTNTIDIDKMSKLHDAKEKELKRSKFHWSQTSNYWLYQGSDEKYDYLVHKAMNNTNQYKIQSGQLNVKNTFPKTPDSSLWVIVKGISPQKKKEFYERRQREKKEFYERRQREKKETP